MSDTPSGLRSQPSGFGSRQLEHFRSDRKRLPLHPLEKAVLTVVALHLCFLPWALGTMHVWSQLTSLGFSVLGLAIALIPRTYSGDYAVPFSPVLTINNPQPISSSPDATRLDESRRSLGEGGRFQLSAFSSQVSPANPQVSGFRINPLPRLLKFPLFWIGLMLLSYIAIQGFNPSWVWERNATTWWLRRVNDIPWLPTSIATPFERFNLWRQFIIYASAWLTLCTVWVGFTRRRSLQILLAVLVGNAIALSAVGYLQGLTQAETLLWLVKRPEGATPFSSFIYKNHAGAYLALITLVAAALATWHFDQGERGMKKSTPAGILALIALFLAGTVFFTLSRGASITLSLCALAFVLWFILRRKYHAAPGTSSAVTAAVALMFLAALVGTVRYVDFSDVSRAFNKIIDSKTREVALEGRVMAAEAGEAMLSDYWWRGVGAGGFRYLFPEYIKKHPAAYEGGKLFWAHAHRDWLEIPIELGATGILLLIMGGAYWVRFFYHSRAAWHSLAVPIFLGCGQTLIHAWFDFPFQNPAILVTWLSLIAISTRWIEIDTAGSN